MHYGPRFYKFHIIFFNVLDFENNFSLENINLACPCTNSELMTSNNEVLYNIHLSVIVIDHWEHTVTWKLYPRVAWW